MAHKHNRKKKYKSSTEDNIYMEDLIYEFIIGDEKVKHIYKKMKKSDIDELNLLNVQIKSLLILFYSDILYYTGVMDTITAATTEGGNLSTRYASDTTIIGFTETGLLAMSLFSIIDIARYKNLKCRKINKEIEFSLLPNIFIIIGSIFNVLVYKYLNRGVTLFYYDDMNGLGYVDSTNKDELLKIFFIERQTVIMRLYADIFFFNATIQGISLIIRKYKPKVLSKVSEEFTNPDVSALNGQTFYFISRMIIYQLTVVEMQIISNEIIEYNARKDIKPLENLLLGNKYGVIANIFLLIGFVKIYDRNKIQPVFGD